MTLTFFKMLSQEGNEIKIDENYRQLSKSESPPKCLFTGEKFDSGYGSSKYLITSDVYESFENTESNEFSFDENAQSQDFFHLKKHCEINEIRFSNQCEGEKHNAQVLSSVDNPKLLQNTEDDDNETEDGEQKIFNVKLVLSIDNEEENSTSSITVCGLEDTDTSDPPPMDLSMMTVCHSPDKTNEMSFYDNSPVGSPQPCSISPYRGLTLADNNNSPSNYIITPSNEIERRAFHEVDFNALDCVENRKHFKFAEPSGAAPKTTPYKRIDNNDSPKAVRVTPRKSGSCFRPLDSMGDSMESNDDCIELLDMELIDEHDTLPPANIDSVISGELAIKRTPLRRGLSLDESITTGRRMRTSIKNYEMDESMENSPPFVLRGFKRTEKPMISPIHSKRWKSENEEKENKGHVRHVLQKSISLCDSSQNIMNALAKDDLGLIGDFSKPFCLPLITNGNHCDLKSISAHTVAKLLNGDFKETVASYRIIDCRYPYEYKGGHIQNAENVYTHDEIIRVFLNNKTETATVVTDEPKRNIIIFHCEFSSERGPKLSRFLRSKDREANNNTYPALHYPEIYLLHEGYKEFFKHYSDLCDPKTYLPMLAPSHDSAYRHFRATTKSWNGDRLAGPSRSGRSRSRLML